MGEMRMCVLVAVMVVVVPGAAVTADDFGTGANAFTLEFVTISGASNPGSGYGIVNSTYRMGTREISNDQWNKFEAAYGTVRGHGSNNTGINLPTEAVNWNEAAQFVNWLNTSMGHQAAYNFTGGIFTTWTAAEAANGTNLYRHKDAVYFLPTEDEWVKAAYWNSATATLQTYATKDNSPLERTGEPKCGSGGWVYRGPFGTIGIQNVGFSPEELNGTRDMMGNVMEWMESPSNDTNYAADALRGLRGGAFNMPANKLALSNRDYSPATNETFNIGFRVASTVPEPGCIAMVVAGVVCLLGYAWRR